ncbi:SNF2 family N-terminal domain-containing protein [Xylariaceae sp. FL0255]|nr:SNF2 family N-terminal domain-containing protein [Xylariaceae sp. FL0255]
MATSSSNIPPSGGPPPGNSHPSTSSDDSTMILSTDTPEGNIAPADRALSPVALSKELMPHQRIGLTWLIQREEGILKSAILADDMGLGKTMQALALILARPSTDETRKATLIVMPTALLHQWEQEIKDKIKPEYKLSVFVYHGTNKKKIADVADILAHDIVLTTYGTLTSEYKRMYETRKEHGVRLLVPEAIFHRAILDEAHNIKKRDGKASRGADKLRCKYRLCMTGTPLMNNVDELYPLFRFLKVPRLEEWDNFTPYKRGPDLQNLMKRICLRRTVKTEVDGQPIFTLPTLTIETVETTFDSDQQAIYDALSKKTKLEVNRYVEEGTFNRNYIYILVLLLRLRQCCDHPFLLSDISIPQGIEMTAEDMVKLVAKFSRLAISNNQSRDNEEFDCKRCGEKTKAPIIIFPCGHHLCGGCITEMATAQAEKGKGKETAEEGDTQSILGDCPTPGCSQKITSTQVVCYQFFKEAQRKNTNSKNSLDDFVVPDDYESDGEGGYDDAAVVEDEKTTPTDPTSVELSDSELYKGSSYPNKRQRTRGKRIVFDSDDDDDGNDNYDHKGIDPGQKRKRAHISTEAMDRYCAKFGEEWKSSAKIDKVMELMEMIREKHPGEKTLIFSQFTSFLDLLEIPIQDAGIVYRRYVGSMNTTQRDAAVDSFMNDPNVNVMLLSLKCGNAGLNLYAATRVILLDPFWNPAVEAQAIARAHRLGQTQPVTAYRLLVPKTVEDRILELQEEKRMVVDAALSTNGGAAASDNSLSTGELVGLFGLDES